MSTIEPDLVQTLALVVDILEHASVSYALIGGVAKAAWGRARATHDIDIAITGDVDALADLRARLLAAQFVIAMTSST